MQMLRPTLLHRYILKEFLPPFAVGLMAFTFVLILHQLFLMMDLFLNRGVATDIILKMCALIIPMFLPLAIPMACLFAALLSYGRLSEEGELTALRSAGCHHIQYCLPNIFLGLLLSVFLLHYNLNLAPKANAEFKKIYFAVAQQNPLALFAPKVINYFGEYKVFVDKMDRKKKRLSGITIYKMNPVGAPTRILAPEGELRSFPGEGITLELTGGAVHQPNPDKENEYTITKFSRFALRIPTQLEAERRAPTPRELTLRQLQNKIEESLRAHVNPAPWKTERELRTAIAFGPLVFILLGITLGVRTRRGSKSVGIALSGIVILCYYGLYYPMIALASRGTLPAFLFAWFPNCLAFAIGGMLWLRLVRH